MHARTHAHVGDAVQNGVPPHHMRQWVARVAGSLKQALSKPLRHGLAWMAVAEAQCNMEGGGRTS
jgi:hypothetical protein